MNNQHQQSGNLYYIKLKTDLGIFYKIGFTTYQNINDRFNYDNSNDYRLIQETLMFQYYDDAYLKEQRLHKQYKYKKAFYKYSNESYLPLPNNGQSELYYDDILSLDKNFSKKEKNFTKLKVYIAIFKSNPIKIILFMGFTIAVFIGTFPYSLGFILFVYVVSQPEDNIFIKLWKKFKRKKY
jgi:hypothetical protein